MHPGAQVVKEATLQHCNVASCNRTYREISKAASKSVCKPVATPKVSKGRAESPWSPRRGEILCETEKKQGGPFLAIHKKSISCKTLSASRGGPRRFPKGERKALWSPPQRRNLKTEKARRPFSLPSTRNPFLVENPIRIKRWAPKVSKGRAESPLVASAEAKPSNRKEQGTPFPLPSTRNPFLVENPIRIKRWAPKVSKGRSESPLVASAEAKPCKTEKARRPFSLAIHKKPVPCERFRPPAGGRGTFPRGKYLKAPGASKGCMSHGRPGPRC